MILTSMAQVIQATTASIPLPSKLWLFVVRTDEWLPVIDNTSTMTTWVKGYQLSTIWQRRPEWKVASHRRYEYNDNLSEGLPVINNMIKTTWVKGCQSSTIWVQLRPEWKVISYQRYGKNGLSEGLQVIDNTCTITTWVNSCQSSTTRVQKWLV